MQNRWAWHAYVQAHKGDNCIVHTEKGFVLHDGRRGVEYEIDLKMNTPRSFLWHPDCRLIAFWAPATCEQPRRRVAILDITKQVPGSKPKYTILYDPEPGHEPVGLEWAANGKAIILMELVFENNAAYTVIRRIKLQSKPHAGKELVRMHGRIDFFNGPTTRFEYGAGSTDKPFNIVFGAADGLYTVPGNGELPPHRLAKVPAEGLENIEWNPMGDQFAVYFNRQTNNRGEELQGLYLADVNRRGKENMIRLYENLDVNTLWFSAKGTYVLWSTYPMSGRISGMDSAIYIAPTDNPTEILTIKQDDEYGNPLPITGVYMNKEETQIAYTAHNRVFVYDLKSGKRKQIAKFESRDPQMLIFTAEPHWLGKRVVVSVYEDISKEMSEKRNTLTIELPFKHADKFRDKARQKGGMVKKPGEGDAPPK